MADGTSGIIAWAMHQGDAEGFAMMFADQPGKPGRHYVVVDERTGVAISRWETRR